MVLCFPLQITTANRSFILASRPMLMHVCCIYLHTHTYTQQHVTALFYKYFYLGRHVPMRDKAGNFQRRLTRQHRLICSLDFGCNVTIPFGCNVTIPCARKSNVGKSTVTYLDAHLEYPHKCELLPRAFISTMLTPISKAVYQNMHCIYNANKIVAHLKFLRVRTEGTVNSSSPKAALFVSHSFRIRRQRGFRRKELEKEKRRITSSPL